MHLLDLHSKLVIVWMLCQTDLPCTADVLEVALERLVDLLDSVQQVGIPLILQQAGNMMTTCIGCSTGQETTAFIDSMQPDTKCISQCQDFFCVKG